MKNFLLLFTIFTFCGWNSLSAQEDKEWTLLLYVIGTDIVQDAITDINEIKAAGNTDNINIVGLIGGATIPGWETPSTSVFVNGEEVTQSFTPTDNIMVSTTNLTEFVNWGIENYPAEKYMIAFYNHGMATRGFGHENVSDSQFSINDLKTGLENTNFHMNGNKFEVLGFDACLMALIETQNVLKDFAHYYLASEEEEPWHAWNWTPIIKAMNDQPGLTGVQLGTIAIDSFIQHSLDNNSHGVTLSLTDLSKVEALETAIENVYNRLDDNVYLSNFIRARGLSEEYAKSVSDPSNSEDVVDIGDLFSHLKTLEPTISSEIDEVLSKLNEAVVYEKSDAARPRATGISIYVPYNQFQNHDNLTFFTDNYHTIGHSQVIKDFIKNNYVPFAVSDNSPIAGTIDHTLGLTGHTGNTGRGVLGENYSAIRLDEQHAKDLDQIQVILLEEIVGDPDELLVLGSTHVDTIVYNEDGSVVYGYKWDEDWLSVAEKPAYIADIQDFNVTDEDGNVIETFTRLHKPAILNPGTENEKNIILNYKADANNNYTLEGIEGEPYLVETTLVPSKERFHLEAGGQVQMLFEIFDVNTNESSFVPDADIITIENGNSDLSLFHHPLEPGDYHVGFVLMDHAQNDTIIYDPMVRTVLMTNTIETELKKDLVVFPNPFIDQINIKNRDAKAIYTLTNVLGIEVFRGERIWNTNFSKLQTGIYYLSVEEEGEQKRVVSLFKE